MALADDASIRGRLVPRSAGNRLRVYTDVSAGFGIGRRIRAGLAAVDVALAPAIAVMHMEYDTPAGAEGKELEGTEVALRFDASARLAVPVAARWQLTVILDASVTPALLVTPARVETPRGPGAWMGKGQIRQGSG
jgi:hypothetical protein